MTATDETRREGGRGPTPDPGETERTRARYQRIAPFYDALEILAERRYRPWRRALWSRVRGPRVLEIGVGTGKNMPFYPPELEVTALDLTPGMLERARRRARRLGVEAELRLGDVQDLQLPDDSFDAAVATFVFCSVPDPVRGLGELARVVSAEGRIHLLEHVPSHRPLLGWWMEILNPLVVRLIGANIDRRTVRNARRAGLTLERVEDLWHLGIFKRITAIPNDRRTS